jgi:hypothetical protein
LTNVKRIHAAAKCFIFFPVHGQSRSICSIIHPFH